MNLFPNTPIRQMDFYYQKLKEFQSAGIPELTAKKLAMQTGRALFKRHSRPLGKQLCWHFQGDFSGQQYLFKEQKR